MTSHTPTRVAGKTLPMVTRGEPIPARAVLWLNGAVLVLVLISAFGVIHSTHACRELYARLQLLEARQWHLQEDYGRLLLEESAWASHKRVESVARGELLMAEPELSRYRVVLP